MTNILRYLLVSGVAILAVGGCAGSPGSDGEVGASYAEYSPDEPGVGDAAQLRGVVKEDKGCLRVIASETDVVYTPIFPISSTIPDSLTDGDDVSLRGGALDTAPPDVTTNGCEAPPFWLVVDE